MKNLGGIETYENFGFKPSAQNLVSSFKVFFLLNL